MHFDIRLWSFTKGVRGRIAYAVMIGMISTSLGVVRLGMLGWLIGLIFLLQVGSIIPILVFEVKYYFCNNMP